MFAAVHLQFIPLRVVEGYELWVMKVKIALVLIKIVKVFDLGGCNCCDLFTLY